MNQEDALDFFDIVKGHKLQLKDRIWIKDYQFIIPEIFIYNNFMAQMHGKTYTSSIVYTSSWLVRDGFKDWQWYLKSGDKVSSVISHHIGEFKKIDNDGKYHILWDGFTDTHPALEIRPLQNEDKKATSALKENLDSNGNKICTCDWVYMVQHGCKCGAMEYKYTDKEFLKITKRGRVV